MFYIQFYEVDIRGAISFLKGNNEEIMKKKNSMLKKIKIIPMQKLSSSAI